MRDASIDVVRVVCQLWHNIGEGLCVKPHLHSDASLERHSFWMVLPLSFFLSLGTTLKMTGSRCWRVCVCVFNPPPMNLSHFCLFHRFQPALLLAKALCAWRSFVFFFALCQKGARDVTNRAEDSVCPFFFSSLPTTLFNLSWLQTLIHPLLFSFFWVRARLSFSSAAAETGSC